MPKNSDITFSVQPVKKNGRVSGYVVAGFFTKKQLAALHSMIDSVDYIRKEKLKLDIKSIGESMKEALN